jgi:hypothetical protein
MRKAVAIFPTPLLSENGHRAMKLDFRRETFHPLHRRNRRLKTIGSMNPAAQVLARN